MSDLNEIIKKLKLLTQELEGLAKPIDPYEGVRVHFPDILSGYPVAKIEEERVDTSTMDRPSSILGAVKVSFTSSFASFGDFEEARFAFIVREGKVTARGKCEVPESTIPFSGEPAVFTMRFFPEY